MNKELDILAFGAHPDDVEIGMGATLAHYSEMGWKVGICDLTRAELSSNGTLEIRESEAKKAADLLGVNTRLQLGFPDRGFFVHPSFISQIVEIIRSYRPTHVFAPFSKDRHPDHVACHYLVKEAVFNAGLAKFEVNNDLPPFRPKNIFYYLIHQIETPDLVMDVTNTFHKKKAALEAYQSQFLKKMGEVSTPLNNGYIERVESRDRLFGHQAGVTYGEGFFYEKPVLIKGLFE
ncbi:bacillithiol biosynthesis deacetylase BshB1 [Microaerobacter geothermalis]|nr:bacillithiol biosynthesis deacetylase BshB1 [Microaerobacter geothermalis]MCF6093354.1 bacillithiol biosynthesis deacetylase BshB1 [Microaerobacter geothermalis]